MAESQGRSREAKVDFDDDVLEVIAQGPGPGPGPSDEKLDFDDDTLKAIAEVHQEEGDKEFTRKEVCNAIYFYTKGIEANCKDVHLNAKLYSNRATAYYHLESTMSEARRSRRLRGLQPDTHLGLCFICQAEFQIEAMRRYVRTNCCGAMLHRSCFISMTTRANFCGNCRRGFRTDAPEIDLTSYETVEDEEEIHPLTEQIEEWLMEMTVDQINALTVIFTGQTYPLNAPPIQEDYFEALTAIRLYRDSNLMTRIHNIRTLSWVNLPYTIMHNYWSTYMMILHSYITHITESPFERARRPFYIHATVYFPYEVFLHSNNRYTIYLMFLKMTPTIFFRCVDLFRFRFFFIATSTVIDSIEFANIRYSNDWSEPFYYDVIIEQ